ncbi:NfeD family protein [bacterium]|nr:NfeD family protein [bacterium]
MIFHGITLDTMSQVFYNIALFSTICFVIKLILFVTFGGDTEVNADFNSEVDTDASFNFISVQSLLAFLMGFGWMGYAAATQYKLSQLYCILSALGVGLLFMFGSAYLMFLAKKLEKNVKKDKATAIGTTGKAYTNFAPQGSGKVEIDISGQLTIADARNITDEEIHSFEVIKVTGIKDNILEVEKYTEA